MKSNFPLKNLYSLLLALVFFIGLPTLSQAQLTVKNRTSCTIYLQASQVKNGAEDPCTRCNVSSVTAIPAGGTWVHPGDATCGHFTWLGVRWYLHIDGIHGFSYNPIWAGACGAEVRGGRCDETLTYAHWDVPSSPGPATVTIY